MILVVGLEHCVNYACMFCMVLSNSLTWPKKRAMVATEYCPDARAVRGIDFPVETPANDNLFAPGRAHSTQQQSQPQKCGMLGANRR